jgi:hypothetical protein
MIRTATKSTIEYSRRCWFLTSRRKSQSKKEASTYPQLKTVDVKRKSDVLFLHIAPCGDFWTGHEVFAAKHLQPDYVRSIAIPADMEGSIESMLYNYDGDLDALLKRAYDKRDISIIIQNVCKQSIDDE